MKTINDYWSCADWSEDQVKAQLRADLKAGEIDIHQYGELATSLLIRHRQHVETSEHHKDSGSFR